MPAYLLRQGQGKASVIYSRCEDEAFSGQAEQFSQFQPRRSELRTPAFSVTFNHPNRLPPEMVREVGQYGWKVAGPSAYPLVMAFDPDNVARPLSERDCELAAGCCLAVGRLVARLAKGSRLEPTSDSSMEVDGVQVDIDKYIRRHKRTNENHVFYIPAQRVLTLANGWPRPFQGYGAEDPFVVRDFSGHVADIVAKTVAAFR